MRLAQRCSPQLGLVEQRLRSLDSSCIDRFGELIDEYGKRLPIFGGRTAVVAQIEQRQQLEPWRLLRSGLCDRPPNGTVGDSVLATPARDRSLE
jgi:hypothetical protein